MPCRTFSKSLTIVKTKAGQTRVKVMPPVSKTGSAA